MQLSIVILQFPCEYPTIPPALISFLSSFFKFKDALLIQFLIVGEASGFNRYETSTSGTLEQGSAVTLTKNNYKEVFTVIGENTLVTQAETKNLIGTIQLSSDFQLNIDFSLGDSVTYLNNQWGIQENVMIRELRLQYSTNGFIAQASLGYPLPTLEDKLGVTLS